MAQKINVEYTYIFYCDGNFFEQNVFGSDEDAIEHAKNEAEKRGKPVKVARWLEFQVSNTPNKACNLTILINL